MKLRKDYVLRRVAGSWVVLPLGKAALDFNGMLTLNESGVMLWHGLEEGKDREALATVLTDEYDVSYQRALSDVDEYLAKLASAGCIETE